MRRKNYIFILVPVIIISAAVARMGRASGDSQSVDIQAEAVFFRPLESSGRLYSVNADEVRSIASLSKLMAGLVIVERGLKLDEVTEITRADRRVGSGGSRSRLLLGARFTNRDLLYAALLASDNVAVSALGRAVGLQPAELVQEMNRRARLMGLKHTEFKDPVGIDHGNVSTAREVAHILRAALKNNVLSAVMARDEYFVRAVWPRNLTANYLNTNLLMHRGNISVVGGKTGYNSRAGYCFASAIKTRRHGVVLGVVLGSRSKLSRFRDFRAVVSEIN